MKTIGLLMFCILISGCSEEGMRKFMEVPETTYTFKKLNLPDGTPCHHINISGHSAASGITCNYGAAK